MSNTLCGRRFAVYPIAESLSYTKRQACSGMFGRAAERALMQTFWRIMLGLLALIVGVAAIIAGVMPDLAADHLLGVAEALINHGGYQAGFIATGIVVALLPIVALVKWYASRRYGRDLTYNTDHGQVSVSLQAIEEALTRVVEKQPSVRRVTVRCREDRIRRVLIAEVALALWEDEDVTGQNRRYQDLLRQRLSELMPEQDSVQVHLLVHRLSPRSAVEPATTPEQPVTDDQATAPSPPAASLSTSRITLPGLSATAGSVDNRAGAELLRRRRESRDESDDSSTADDRDQTVATDTISNRSDSNDAAAADSAAHEAIARAHESGAQAQIAATDVSGSALEPPDAAMLAAAQAADAASLVDDDDEDPYADLYRGPTYPVPDQGENSGEYPGASV